jgi:release factor glutamine methyltransferase
MTRREGSETVSGVIKSAEKALKAAGSTEPVAEALFFASHASGLKLSELRAKSGERATAEVIAFMNEAVFRRQRREPPQHITGIQEFYGLDFLVTPDVLIPRPETELIVDEALAFLKERKGTGKGVLRCLDLCTGSGCVVVAMAANAPDALFDAVDISGQAVMAAILNAGSNGVAKRIRFFEGDLFNVEGGTPGGAPYDLITANPPYVADADVDALEPEVRVYEPRVALSGGEDGLEIIRRIVIEAPRYLGHGGMLLMEMGYGQAEAVAGLFNESRSFCRIEIKKDLAGVERVVKAVRV